MHTSQRRWTDTTKLSSFVTLSSVIIGAADASVSQLFVGSSRQLSRIKFTPPDDDATKPESGRVGVGSV